MNAPRLLVDLDKIYHNARTLVERLAKRDILVTGVTKATLGSPEIAKALLLAGVNDLGDSRIENIETMRRANIPVTMSLIRSPMLSQIEQIVNHADISFNTEIAVIRQLSIAAQMAGRQHGVVLMIELGDLREGIMPGDLAHIVGETLSSPNIALKGIGTNLACRYGVSPDAANMEQLSMLADAIEDDFDLKLEIISGGNSANLQWLLGDVEKGRINNLRLGESILLGREPVHRNAIDGLYTDAFTLSAEVIESKIKPSRPSGNVGQTAFGYAPLLTTDRDFITQEILAVGQQDIDPNSLIPPCGVEIQGASSDHLILESIDHGHPIGTELDFQLNYSSLMRAMTSPFVTKIFKESSVSLTCSSLADQWRFR